MKTAYRVERDKLIRKTYRKAKRDLPNHTQEQILDALMELELPVLYFLSKGTLRRIVNERYYGRAKGEATP